MGLLRWMLIIGTGGLAPVKGTSPRERTAKAAERAARTAAPRRTRRPGPGPVRTSGVRYDSRGRMRRD